MLTMHHVKNLVAAGALLLPAWGVGSVANAAEPFTLTSTTFKDGTLMPKKVANQNPANPNCWSIRKVAAASACSIGWPTAFPPT